MKRSIREQSKFHFGISCAVATLVMLISLVVVLLVEDGRVRTIYMDVVSPLADLAGSLLLFIAARGFAAKSRRLMVAWAIMGLALLSYTIGDLIWSILEVGELDQAFPSAADAFYLIYYPLFLVGVIHLQERHTSRAELINKIVEVGIIGLSAVLINWNFIMGPIVAANTGLPRFQQFILFSYPAGDLVLFLALIMILYNHSRSLDGRSIILLVFSLLATIVSDTIYSYDSIRGIYITGGLVDLGWIASSLLVGLAGLSALASLHTTRVSRPSPWISFLARIFKLIGQFFPYIWMLGAFLLLVIGGTRSLPMSFPGLAWAVGGIILLVLIRQVNTLNENLRLNQQLQVAVHELQNEILERKKIEERLSYDNLHDSLTGLANRILFMDRLSQAIEYSKRSKDNKFAVLFIDLDRFKVVNDSLGHLVGDQLLIAVAQRLKKSLRSSDTIARFGGDEFEILLKITSSEKTALTVAEKVLAILAAPYQLDEHEVFISASIGIVPSLGEYDRAETLLRDADLAMYQAKAQGGSRSTVFKIEMRHQAFFRMEMENELRSALENEEFILCFQPVISLDANQLVDLEALLRWKHPGRGILLPNEFLPVAEESGLILPIGDWVLRSACQQMKAWQEQYPALREVNISVNISSRQLTQANFVEKVIAALDQSGLKPRHLKLEITEGVLIHNFSATNEVFMRLRKLGVKLEIDDFGTGYSALGYLQHFPVNAIKIDRTFINEMDKNKRGIELVRAIVSMAHELDIQVIAEGIETRKQLADLRKMVCGYGQGFLLCKPFDPQAVDKAMASLSALSR